jgi:hypothetical protein
MPRRNSQDVLEGLVTGLRRLVLSREVELGRVIGLGGYADVYEGILRDEKTGETKKIAVKRFRMILSKEKEFAKVEAVCLDCDTNPMFTLVHSVTLSFLPENCVFGRGLITRTCCD